jgi:hypothetical protein
MHSPFSEIFLRLCKTLFSVYKGELCYDIQSISGIEPKINEE